jgi:hypothetical protein
LRLVLRKQNIEDDCVCSEIHDGIVETFPDLIIIRIPHQVNEPCPFIRHANENANVCGHSKVHASAEVSPRVFTITTCVPSGLTPILVAEKFQTLFKSPELLWSFIWGENNITFTWRSRPINSINMQVHPNDAPRG